MKAAARHRGHVVWQASLEFSNWSIADSLVDELTWAALDRALETRRPAPGLIDHSDRGSQYASYDYRKKLGERGVIASMSRRGNRYDNAPSERLVSSFKTEWLPKGGFAGKDLARAAIFEYIVVVYNRQRRHSALGGVSPARYEVSRREQAT